MHDFLRRTRVRLTLLYTLLFALASCAAAVGFWLGFGHLEYTIVDDSLTAQARIIRGGIQDSNGQVTFDTSEQLPGESPQGIAIQAYLLAPDGKVLDSSRQQAPSLGYVPPSGPPPRAQTIETVNARGSPLRVLIQPVDLGSSGTGSLVLVRPVQELSAMLVQAAVLLALVVLALVLATAAIAYRMAGRALAPVRVMAAAARDTSEHDLHRRISLDLPSGDELADLAQTLNAMLARLEQAFQSLRRFTADAAHELRAPLALMRTELEVTLRRERTPAQYRESDRALLEEVERLSRTAEQLLLLARADAGALTPRPRRFDLPAMLEEVAERWRPLYAERQVPLVVRAPAGGDITADADLLRRVVDNLLDNALRYSPRDAPVTVAAEREGGVWRVTVEDRGAGVEASIRPVLFERFTRADPARGRDTGGAGLGLSLCAAIARTHGGTITLEELAAGSGARFVVRLPVR
jgi:two-component system, OmpR family, heavy metal sensor histidine kinase CusS